MAKKTEVVVNEELELQEAEAAVLVKAGDPERPMLREGDQGAEVELVCKALQVLGYWEGEVVERFTPLMTSTVKWFQATNLSPLGLILRQDGLVGDLTRWALENSTAEKMRQRLFQQVPKGLSAVRQAFIRACYADHARGTREMPDGSNSGDGVNRFLAKKGPIPWCMASGSEWWKDATGNYPFGMRHTHVETFWKLARQQGVAFTMKNWLIAPGDMAVWLFGRGKGHIAPIVAVDSDPRLFSTCGGNETNSVRLRNRSVLAEASLVGWIRLAGDTGAGHEKGLLQAAVGGMVTDRPLRDSSTR